MSEESAGQESSYGTANTEQKLFCSTLHQLFSSALSARVHRHCVCTFLHVSMFFSIYFLLFLPWPSQGVSNVTSLIGPLSLLKLTFKFQTHLCSLSLSFRVRTVIHLSWTGYSRDAAYVKTLSSWFQEKENLLKHRYSLTFVGWNVFLVGVPAENPGRKTDKPHTDKPLAPWGFEPGS